jgi:hypothetical protein
VKKHKLRLSTTTIQVLQQNLDRVRGGEIVDSEGCNSMCVTWCRPQCKPSPFSRPGDWCV